MLSLFRLGHTDVYALYVPLLTSVSCHTA